MWFSFNRIPSLRVILSIFGCSLCVIASVVLSGCPGELCKGNSDCANGQSCVAGKCAVDSDAGESGFLVDSGEVNKEQDGEQSNEKKSSTPPVWDHDWKEGQFDPPEAFKEGRTPSRSGIRKEGETCNPGITALSVDRCDKKLACVAPFLGPVGVCRATCEPAKDTCPRGTLCGPLASVETGKITRFVCSPTIKEGFTCTFGQPCEMGFFCARVTGLYKGVCRKSCLKRDDCSKGAWCSSLKGLDRDATACVKLVSQEGSSCGVGLVCGNGLICVGSAGKEKCLKKDCDAQNTCAKEQTCVKISDRRGKLLYSACFPLVGKGGMCHTGNRCGSGLRCARFSTTPEFSSCVTDCTKDSKVCAKGEVCLGISSSRKGCLSVAKEGELCEGSVTCDKDLKCLATERNAPRFCLRDCATDPKVCMQPLQCNTRTVGKESLSFCAEGCDPKAPACSSQASACKASNGKGLCLPDPQKLLGKKKQGEPCHLYPGAGSGVRCESGLMCLSFTEGSFCAKQCVPGQGECSSAQKCLFSGQTKQFLCGTPVKSNGTCRESGALLCEGSGYCVHPAENSSGICQTASLKPKGALCAKQFSKCSVPFVCAGRAVMPFRWTCRAPCDETGVTCPDQGVCLQIAEGAACFAPCQAENCSNSLYQCLEIQKKKACL